MDNLTFFVNEKQVTAKEDTDSNLATFLRNELNLTGTKVACGVGGCGSCTVLISRYNEQDGAIKHVPVNACLTPLCSLQGVHVLTVEGLSDSTTFHSIQKALAFENGTQCGYCSPGFVMSMIGLQVQDDVSCNPNVSQIKTALQGNLCRCTGYRPILEAFYKKTDCSNSCKSTNKKCCPQTDIEDAGNLLPKAESGYCIEKVRNVDSKEEILQRIANLLTDEEQKLMRSSGQSVIPLQSRWIVPTSIAELKQILSRNNDFAIVAGCTSDEFWKPDTPSPTLIDVTKIKEMRCVELNENYLRLGASFTIAEMQKELKLAITKIEESKCLVLKALLKMTEVYASPQIRSSATIGGSLMVTSAASDFQTAHAGFGLISNMLTIDSSKGPVKILESINIPTMNTIKRACYEKIRRRKDFDLALVNIATHTSVKPNAEFETTLCFGGTLIQRCSQLEQHRNSIETLVLDKPFIERITQRVSEHVSKNQLKLNPATKDLLKVTIPSLLKKIGLNPSNSEETSTNSFKSTRVLTKSEPGQANHDLVHREVPHASAIKHVTGEAKYCDDVPKFKDELELAFVLSTRPYSKIIKIDFTNALQYEGVVGVVTHEDVSTGRNMYGLVEKDEEIFASDHVTCHGQIIAGIVANTREIAMKAVKLVHVQYEDMAPVILTLEDAITHNSYYSTYDIKLKKGDCAKIFDDCDSHNILSGEVKLGSQDHFYMEPQGCIVIPKGEDGELEIISSTQNPTGIQMAVAHVLEIPSHQIVVKVKRIGGGFGGKESRCIMMALPSAIAAQKFGKPVRCILSRETDIAITGKRATYLTRHKIAFDNNGKIIAMQMDVYIGAGNSIDVTMAEIERVIINLENAYNIPNMDLKGYICKTNLPSNTVFRGTGAPQAAFLMENIMDMVSTYLQKEPTQVRAAQIYQNNDFTPYGQSLQGSNVFLCWEDCLKNSNYHEKRKEIDTFNKNNIYRKRGISINPINYGVGYTVLHLNQGAALVHIYTDGTVLISHGGVELGQGVHTKMTQIATRVLGISADKIKITETSTDKVPNSTPSSASMTSDLNGGAVLNACQILSDRLQPYKLKKPEGSWEEIILDAYLDRVSLSTTGFYKVPEMGWDAQALKGNPWSYFTSGAACSVVELDCLNGQFQIISTDIVMDVGKSLNPSVDVGQIEGAFMQGVGLFLLEELVYDEAGKLCTAGPVTYKIPTVNDTPLEFNVSFLLGPGNPKAIYSSKTVGEPPLLLATSAFFAVKDAIRAYRKSNEKNISFCLDSPATVEKILLACHTTLGE